MSDIRQDLDVPPAAAEWAREQLQVRSLTVVRSRPWAVVGRVATDSGVWWLKVNRGGTTYEPQLLRLLTGLSTALLPRSVSHPSQPWALIADAGRSARELLAVASAEQQLDFWCRLLPRYAELQQDSTRHGWAGVDVPDLSPGRLLTQLDELVGDARWFTAGAAPDLSADELERIRGCRPALARAAALLADGLPVSIQHDDLHDGNVLLGEPGRIEDGPVRIIDWGDAVVAHPFGTLLVTLGALAARWEVPLEDRAVVRVRDAYLEPWRTAGESAAELVHQVDLAVRTGAVSRAAGWVRALGDPAAGPELGFSDAPSGWLLRLADALSPYGPH